MELYHHGIKGQRWGVRRYQNPDGSLTAAGQKRYDRDVAENNMKKKDCYMMHPTGNHIPNNIKIWNRYLKLIDDKKTSLWLVFYI